MEGDVTNEMRAKAIAAAFEGREKIVHKPKSAGAPVPSGGTDAGHAMRERARDAALTVVRTTEGTPSSLRLALESIALEAADAVLDALGLCGEDG